MVGAGVGIVETDGPEDNVALGSSEGRRDGIEVGRLEGLASTLGIVEGASVAKLEGGSDAVFEGERLGKGVTKALGSSVGLSVGEEEGKWDGAVESILDSAFKMSTMSIISSNMRSEAFFCSSISSKVPDGSDWAFFQNSPTLNKGFCARKRVALFRKGPPVDSSLPLAKTNARAKTQQNT
eukprot:scaffold12194_cov129-Cylindrotheca_fusiformis.AAC.7